MKKIIIMMAIIVLISTSLVGCTEDTLEHAHETYFDGVVIVEFEVNAGQLEDYVRFEFYEVGNFTIDVTKGNLKDFGVDVDKLPKVVVKTKNDLYRYLKITIRWLNGGSLINETHKLGSPQFASGW
ncbi:hypothetical protein KAR91_28475 [Candidatus Pacearchaeota archaeon]|nr:hypothetical protein [Candidatus Pacearchaeota archaeon]